MLSQDFKVMCTMANTWREYRSIIHQQMDIPYDKQEDSQTLLFIWTKPKDYATMVHECVHATSWMLRENNGTPLDDSSEETYCYFAQFIMDCIIKFNLIRHHKSHCYENKE